MNKPLQPPPRVVELTDAEAETLDALLEGGEFATPGEAVGAAPDHFRAWQLLDDDAALNKLLDEDEACDGPDRDAEDVFAELLTKYRGMADAKRA